MKKFGNTRSLSRVGQASRALVRQSFRGPLWRWACWKDSQTVTVTWVLPTFSSRRTTASWQWNGSAQRLSRPMRQKLNHLFRTSVAISLPTATDIVTHDSSISVILRQTNLTSWTFLDIKIDILDQTAFYTGVTVGSVSVCSWAAQPKPWLRALNICEETWRWNFIDYPHPIWQGLKGSAWKNRIKFPNPGLQKLIDLTEETLSCGDCQQDFYRVQSDNQWFTYINLWEPLTLEGAWKCVWEGESESVCASLPISAGFWLGAKWQLVLILPGTKDQQWQSEWECVSVQARGKRETMTEREIKE